MKAVGLILAGGNSGKMQELTAKRAVAAMPVAGSYRAIDFALSNMTNSGIGKVAVMTQYSARSLNEHLNSSKWWNFGRKQGGLYVFTPTITIDNEFWYRGTADAIYQNLDFVKQCHEPYVVIASGDAVYKMDYKALLKAHVDSKADITVAVKDISADEDASRFGAVTMDADGKITGFEEKKVSEASTISIGVYVIRRRLLVELVEEAAKDGKFNFVKDILIPNKDVKLINGYKIDTYWNNINTVEAYYQTNMDFLKPEVRNYFFKEEPEVYSKMMDLPPAKYNPGSNVKNSLIASGSIINGTVENSVVFKQVFVGSNVTIKNSVIMDGVYIGDGVTIENCIVESRSTLKPNASYVGTDGIKVVVEDNERYTI